MSYFTRYMDKCSRLHSFPVTRYNSIICLQGLSGRAWVVLEGDHVEHRKHWKKSATFFAKYYFSGKL